MNTPVCYDIGYSQDRATSESYLFALDDDRNEDELSELPEGFCQFWQWSLEGVLRKFLG